MVWTGEEMIVWGGETSDGGTRLADGAAFDPLTGIWRPLAASPLTPRVLHIAAWTGEEMLVVGGRGEIDGAAYDPTSDTWRVIADSPVSNDSESDYDMTVGSAWTGQELAVWGISTNQTAAFSPEQNTWRDLPSIDMPGETGTLRWTGADLYAFADQSYSYPSETELQVARLNQEGGWEIFPRAEFSTEDLIVAADARLVAWEGDRFVAWTSSGSEGKTLALSPSDGTWTESDPIPIPPCEGQGEPIPAGDRVVAPGWCGPSLAILVPATSSWTTAAVVGYPTARYTVWTGTELLNWGGGCCYTLDAWRYVLTD